MCGHKILQATYDTYRTSRKLLATLCSVSTSTTAELTEETDIIDNDECCGTDNDCSDVISVTAAYTFCKNCGIHILYAPSSQSSYLYLNVDCLESGGWECQKREEKPIVDNIKKRFEEAVSQIEDDYAEKLPMKSSPVPQGSPCSSISGPTPPLPKSTEWRTPPRPEKLGDTMSPLKRRHPTAIHTGGDDDISEPTLPTELSSTRHSDRPTMYARANSFCTSSSYARGTTRRRCMSRGDSSFLSIDDTDSIKSGISNTTARDLRYFLGKHLQSTKNSSKGGQSRPVDTRGDQVMEDRQCENKHENQQLAKSKTTHGKASSKPEVHLSIQVQNHVQEVVPQQSPSPTSFWGFIRDDASRDGSLAPQKSETLADMLRQHSDEEEIVFDGQPIV